MSKINIGKDKITSVLSIVIVVAAYAVERLVEIFCTPSRPLALGLSITMVVALAVVLALLFKNKNPFYGMLAALLGYKMLPPSIGMMKTVSLWGEELYFLVCVFASLAFMYLIVRIYRLQNSDDKIQTLPILAIMLAVPFFTEIAQRSYRFIMIKTGNMLYYYFLCFACYTVASLVILAIAYRSNYASMRFTAYFEFVALGINALKKIGGIIALTIANEHVSRSYYCWIAVYAVIAVLFLIAKNKKKALEK